MCHVYVVQGHYFDQALHSSYSDLKKKMYGLTKRITDTKLTLI